MISIYVTIYIPSMNFSCVHATCRTGLGTVLEQWFSMMVTYASDRCDYELLECLLKQPCVAFFDTCLL